MTTLKALIGKVFKIFGDRPAERWLVLFNGLLVVATVALFISGERTLKVAKDSADAAGTSANVAKQTLVAAQRAWIRIENGASVSISFKITNIGKAPAINVMPHAWLVVLRSGGPNPWQEQQRRCGEIKQQQFGIGFTLFPQEEFPANVGFGSWGLGVNANFDEIEKGRAASTDNNHVLLHVIGCIDYTFPTDPTIHHQTGFIRELMKKTLPVLLSPNDGTIPISELNLTDSGMGVGHYAD